jgi:hypothetical protein
MSNPGTDPLIGLLQAELAAATQRAERAEAKVREAQAVLERAHAAIWDAHYGKGISVEYAQAFDREYHPLHARLSQPAAESAWREYMRSDAAKQEMTAESGNDWPDHCQHPAAESAEPSDTKILHWLFDVWEGYKEYRHTNTVTDPVMAAMVIGSHEDGVLAARAAMRKEPAR